MFFPRSKLFRVTAPAVLILGLAGGAYAFTATNTVNQSAAGDGKTAISGYDVKTITYTMNATNPSNLDSVSFVLTPVVAGAPAATTVRASLDGGTTWLAAGACTVASGTWTCTTAGQTVAGATNLEVAATGPSS